MRARCMHVTDPMLKRVARQAGRTLWGALGVHDDAAAGDAPEGRDKAE